MYTTILTLHIQGMSKRKINSSDEVIDLACKRALHFGICSYSMTKKMIENNSHNLPLTGNMGGGYVAYY